MKASDDFKISQDWWNKNKPGTLKSTGLGKVMKEFEDLRTEVFALAKAGSYKGFTGKKLPFDDAVKMLKEKIPAAVDVAKKACNKLLHKDAITVLGKYDAAAQKELVKILAVKGEWEKAYAALLQKLRDKSQEQHDILRQSKDEGHTHYKTVETETKAIETVDGVIANLKKSGKASFGQISAAIADAQKRLVKVRAGFDKLEELHDTAEQALLEMKKFQGGDELADGDRDLQIVAQNDAQKMRNDVFMYHNKAKLMLANAEANVKDMEDALDGIPLDLKALQERTEQVAMATKGLSEDSRRHNNNFTSWENELREMRLAKGQAKREKRPLAEVAKEKGIVTPPDRWKARANGYHAQGEKITAKTSKMLKQAEDLRDKTLAKLKDDMKNDPKIKDALARIKANIESIEKYDKANELALKGLKDAGNQFD